VVQHLTTRLNRTFNTMEQVREAPSRSRPRLLAGDGLVETKGKILEAAFRRLPREGYAALSMREIGRDAGVNHALINYHFRTKDQLVIAVLDEANRQLLARQEAMYRAPGTFAGKWSAARRFYRDDMASGFVRLQAELWAASLSNPGLRDKFLSRIAAWKRVVAEGVRNAFASLEASGTELPPPFTPEVIATWISEFWVGMEFSDLLGEPADRRRHQAALDAMEALLQELDRKVARTAKTSRTPAKRRGK
jgi:AcrR family transcriptional regulator